MPYSIQEVIRRLKECIEESGLTYEQLEKKTGISRSSLQRYANGVTAKIPVDAIQSIADALGVKAEYILGWDDEKPSPEDSELREYLEELKNRPEMKMLFKTLKGTSKEDVEKTVKIIEALKGNSE
nr:helix-turn-helix transcriptional regulator [uncultured Ruminococcus sp.]